MNLRDKIKLFGLAEKYGTGLDLEAFLDVLPRVHEHDLAAITGALHRLPPDELDRLAESPMLARAVERFAASTWQPKRLVLACLKLGVTTRLLKLPRPLRDALDIDARVEDGKLLLDGLPVDLIGITIEQHLDLKDVARRVVAGESVVTYPPRR